MQAEDSDTQEVDRQTGRQQEGEIGKREDRHEADKNEADTEVGQADRQTGRWQIEVEAGFGQVRGGKADRQKRTCIQVNRHSSRQARN